MFVDSINAPGPVRDPSGNFKRLVLGSLKAVKLINAYQITTSHHPPLPSPPLPYIGVSSRPANPWLALGCSLTLSGGGL